MKCARRISGSPVGRACKREEAFDLPPLRCGVSDMVVRSTNGSQSGRLRLSIQLQRHNLINIIEALDELRDVLCIKIVLFSSNSYCFQFEINWAFIVIFKNKFKARNLIPQWRLPDVLNDHRFYLWPRFAFSLHGWAPKTKSCVSRS